MRLIFEKFCQGWRSPGDPVAADTRQVLDYFEMRQEYEAQDFSRFDTARLIRYREAKKQFAGERYDALYTQWQAGGRAAALAVLGPGRDLGEAPIERLSTYVLNHDYDLFGTPTSQSADRPLAAGVQTEP